MLDGVQFWTVLDAATIERLTWPEI